MSDWWTYRLSDFLLFSPRTYYRMIERYNEAVWPAHLITMAIGCLMLVLLLRPRAGQPRMLWLVLGLLWAWIGWAYLWRRYSTINWAAMYLVPLFAIESLLLGWASWRSKPVVIPRQGSTARSVGLVLLGASVVVYPAIAALAGRPWRQAEVFGLSPDPTAIATLGLALLLRPRSRASLLVIPALWCLFSGLTLWAMASPEAWVPPLAVTLALVAGSFSRMTSESPNGQSDSYTAGKKPGPA
jgi:hypothetical protein